MPLSKSNKTFITRPLITTALFLNAFSLAPVALADGSAFQLGAEGFYDRYQEPDPAIGVDEHAYYGSVTSGYAYSFGSTFAAVEVRGSYGRDYYKSVSGTSNDIPQYETEERLLGGISLDVNGGSVIIPYLGIGSRYFYDNAKDTFTNTGYEGYDRRIWQLYVPIGASWRFRSDNWVYTPNLEVDPLLWGNVNTRLGSITGYNNINNTQHSGYGIRGEFMIGQQDNSGNGWEAGPFIRYWKISDSDIATDHNGNQFIEPNNTRLQTGAALRFRF